jgi:hypothetical protein
MRIKILDGLFLVALGPKRPSGEAWTAYLHRIDGLGAAQTRHIIVTEGGWPTAAQRADLLTRLEGHAVPVAVVSDNALMLGAARALAWFKATIRTFPRSKLRDAIAYLETPANRVDLVERELAALAPRINGAP